MTDFEAYQEYIQRKHNAFCKAVIRYAARDKILQLRRKWERQISLDYLMDEKFVQFAGPEPDEPFPQKRTQNRMKKPNKNTKIRCTAIRRRKRQVQLQGEQAKASRGQNGGGWCCKRLRDRQRHRPVQLPL